MHILVVDDDSINRDVIGAQLNELQHSCKQAVNGKMALKMIEKFDFDIILSDIEMPIMDGIALIQEIRSLPSPKNAIPVIAVTAAESEFDTLQQAGFDNCLRKPIDKITLERTVLEPKKYEPIEESAKTPHSNQILDTEFLMNNYGDKPMITKLLTRYLQADSEEWNTLIPAIENGEWDRASSTAHRVKGAARTIGAHQFAHAASEVETQARDSGVLEATVQSIVEAHTNLISEIGVQYDIN